MLKSSAFTVLALAAVGLGCSSNSGSGFNTDAGGAKESGGPIDTGAAPTFDSGGGGGGGGGLPTGPTFGATCHGAATSLTGTIYAPNGTDPLPNIYAYVTYTPNPFPAGNYCNQCNKPVDASYVQTQSGPDGTFTLDLSNVPAASAINFAINVGRFRKVTHLPVSCGPNTAPAAATTLPGNSSQGDIPKIAVSTGDSDHLDQILNVLGITEYDCYEGRSYTSGSSTCSTIGPVSALLNKASATPLDSYNLLFISCAPSAYMTWGSPAMASNINAFVTAGGRLFATDMSYDYVGQAFPSAITWMGPSGSPQPVDGANVGVAGSYTGNVDDPSLSAWLNHLGATSGSTVPLQGFLMPWSVQSSLPMTSTKIVDGTVKLTTGGSQDVPLTSQFDVNSCGRVIYSSYHTAGGNVTAGSLLPQERILEYLMFEVASCVSAPIK